MILLQEEVHCCWLSLLSKVRTFSKQMTDMALIAVGNLGGRSCSARMSWHCQCSNSLWAAFKWVLNSPCKRNTSKEDAQGRDNGMKEKPSYMMIKNPPYSMSHCTMNVFYRRRWIFHVNVALRTTSPRVVLHDNLMKCVISPIKHNFSFSECI